MKNYFTPALAGLFYIGTVDQILGSVAHVEIRSKDEVYSVDMPVEMFPCDIYEGDMFYVNTFDGVTEIRCGEPEPQ